MTERIVPRGWSLTIALIAALVLRVLVLVGGWGSLAQDDDAYGRLAIYWAETGTFGFPLQSDDTTAGAVGHDGGAAAMRPTAYRPPLYPWLLSWLVDRGRLNLVAVAAVHLWLGLASVGLTFGIASRLGIRWPILPALAVACDPILLRGSQLVMTETLITFFGLAIWGLWLRLASPPRPGLGAFALLGLVLGLSVLTRPTMLPWAVCLIALAFLLPRVFYRGVRGERGERRLAYAPAFVVGLVLALTLLPWIVRNARMLGTPIWATTHGGYTLLLANNPLLYAHFRDSGPSRGWDADNFHRHWAMRRHGDPTELAFWQIPLDDEPIETPIDELADDRLANRAAKATIAREPSMFVLSCVYRIGWFWALAPHEASGPVQLGVGAWYAVWFACALWGVVRIGRAWGTPVWLAPAAFVLTLTLVHAVYWSNMRMRAPLMPIVYVVAAIPLSGLLISNFKKTSRGEAIG